MTSIFGKPSAPSTLSPISSPVPRLRRILVPLDFSGKSRQALRYAVPIAQKFSARIHLVHVLPPAPKTPKDDLVHLRLAALKRLGEMAEQLLPKNVRSENAVTTGKPAKAILTLAQKNNIDLIILTTKGVTGLKRVLLGSTAEYIMRHAACPVMSLRRN